jgi:hypothetical protein
LDRLDAGQWYRLIQLYSSISHNDSVIVVSSLYFYIRVVGWGKDRWFHPPFGCIQKKQGVVASFWFSPENCGVGASLKL